MRERHGLSDVLDRVLGKGIMIEHVGDASIAGLATADARVVVSTIEVYLRYEAGEPPPELVIRAAEDYLRRLNAG
jgi:hypothetical protein